MSQPAASSTGTGCMEMIKSWPWDKIMRGIGIILGLLVIILGIINIVTFSGFTIYQIIFGILMVLSEVRWFRALDKFSFLKSYGGLGAFYIFVGGLALGSAWYEIVLAIVMCAQGIVYLAMSCARREMVWNRRIYSNNQIIRHRDAEQQNGPPASAAVRPPSIAAKEIEESAWPEDAENRWPANSQ